MQRAENNRRGSYPTTRVEFIWAVNVICYCIYQTGYIFLSFATTAAIWILRDLLFAIFGFFSPSLFFNGLGIKRADKWVIKHDIKNSLFFGK